MNFEIKTLESLSVSSLTSTTSTSLNVSRYRSHATQITYADATPSAKTVNTGTGGGFDETTYTVTKASHGLTTGMKVALTIDGGSLPTGLSATNYYIIKVSANTFKLASSYANAVSGSVINFTTKGSDGQVATFTPDSINTASLTLQKSVDGSNWVNVASATTISSATPATIMLEEKDVAYSYLRLVTALAAGAITVTAITSGVER